MDTDEGTELKYYPPVIFRAMAMLTARETMLTRQLRATEDALLEIDRRAQEAIARNEETIKELRTEVDGLRERNARLARKTKKEDT